MSVKTAPAVSYMDLRDQGEEMAQLFIMYSGKFSKETNYILLKYQINGRYITVEIAYED